MKPVHFFFTSSLRVAIIAALGVSLIACTTAPGAADSATLSKINRVGVVSATADKLFHYKVGFTVFGNENGAYDITDWGLDDVWEDKIANALNEAGVVEAIDLNINRAPIYASYPPENAWPRQWRILDFEALSETFQQIAAEQGVDALVVLSSDGFDVGRAGVILEGVSLYSEDGPLRKPTTHYWLVTRLYLVDGATGKPVASTVVGEEHMFSIKVPLENAPEELSAKMFGEYSEDDVAFLRDRYIALPDQYLTESVNKLMTPKK